MVKFCERTDVFSYSWTQVAQAFWHRYPNPFSTHVITEDVLDRRIQDGKLYSKRLLTKAVRIPMFGQVIKNEPIIEESVIDPLNQRIVTYTRNVGPKTAAVIEEKCLYYTSDTSSLQTTVSRQAWITAKCRFSHAIETYLARKSRKAINRTCMGLQHVLGSMFPTTVLQESKTSILIDNTEKFREKAKKATERAKSRAVPLLAACNPNKQ